MASGYVRRLHKLSEKFPIYSRTCKKLLDKYITTCCFHSLLLYSQGISTWDGYNKYQHDWMKNKYQHINIPFSARKKYYWLPFRELIPLQTCNLAIEEIIYVQYMINLIIALLRHIFT